MRTNFGYAAFAFDRIYTADGVIYFVSVADQQGASQYFKMQMKKGVWRIVADKKIPEWIIDLESVLSKAIDEHLPFSP